jgi:hypothetical protein
MEDLLWRCLCFSTIRPSVKGRPAAPRGELRSALGTLVRLSKLSEQSSGLPSSRPSSRRRVSGLSRARKRGGHLRSCGRTSESASRRPLRSRPRTTSLRHPRSPIRNRSTQSRRNPAVACMPNNVGARRFFLERSGQPAGTTGGFAAGKRCAVAPRTSVACFGASGARAQLLTTRELRSSEPSAERAWTRTYGAAVGAAIAVSKPSVG